MSRIRTLLRFCRRADVTAFVLCITSGLLSGCGGTTSVFSLTHCPTAPLRAGQTFQFSANLNGKPAKSGVTWTLQGTGSATQVGNITQAGLYTAPAALQQPSTVTVQASHGGTGGISSIPIQVLPPVPVITAASTAVLPAGPLEIEVSGASFLPQTKAFLDGIPETLTYLDSGTAAISGTVPPGDNVASLVLQNPWDQDASNALSFMVEAPKVDPPSGANPGDLSSGGAQGFVGCTNPNTGTPSNDWGVGTDPVYLDPASVNVWPPSSNSNTIFWVSREAEPGQSVLMTGAFTNTPKTVKVAQIPSGTLNWQQLVENTGTIVPTQQQATTGLSFIVPSTFAPGVYGFEVDDPSAPPIQGLANVPELSWAVGVPATTDPNAALQHQVYDCGAEPGGILDIFGKNFVFSNHVILQASDGTVFPLTPLKVDTNSISVVIPGSITPGTYNIWVGNPTWDATSSPVNQLVIFMPSHLTATTTSCQGLVGDGITDNAAPLQACLDRYAPAAGTNNAVYITIPAGTFAVTTGITPHPYEVLVGASSEQTKFLGVPAGNPPPAWITMPQHFGLVGISLTAPANPYLVASSSTDGNPLTCGHLFFDDVKLDSTADISNGREILAYLSGPDVEVYNSSFVSGSNQSLSLTYGDGGVIAGNEFVLNNFTGLSIGDSQNIVFDNNLIRSDNTPGDGPNGHSGGAGLAINRSFSQFGASALSQDIYIGYNHFRDMGSPDQQAITNDGGGGAYYGFVGDSTASTVTLAADPAWNWMGTANPTASSIAIVSGRGVGQYSLIKSYSGRTINLLTPWKVVPDSSSIVAITAYQLNITIAHNSFTNVLGCSICLVDSLHGLIEDNETSNSPASSILVGAFGPYGGPAGYGPTIDMDVLRNSTPSLWVQDMPGCLVSGILIRGNKVPAPGVIRDTDGNAGVSAVLVEQNWAAWYESWFYTPGFLAQDNMPPPPS